MTAGTMTSEKVVQDILSCHKDHPPNEGMSTFTTTPCTYIAFYNIFIFTTLSGLFAESVLTCLRSNNPKLGMNSGVLASNSSSYMVSFLTSRS